jgi:hypothetical protein
VVTIAPHPSSPPENPIDGARSANDQARQSAREPGLVVRLDESFASTSMCR